MNTYKYYLLSFALLFFFSVLLFIYWPLVAPLVFAAKGDVASPQTSAGTLTTETSSSGILTVEGVAVTDKVEATSSTIIFVGDVMLSRAIGRGMEKRQDWTYPFALVKDFLSHADYTVGNLEGPISERGVRVGSIYSFRANPKSVEGLVYAGFDGMSVANNHMWDYGRDAFLDTLAVLSNNQIAYIGGGKNFTEAHTAVIRDIKGTKVAFLSYTSLLPSFLGDTDAAPSVAFPVLEQMNQDIYNAKNAADVVIVSFHFGNEYETKHNVYQEELAHHAIDAGAQVVIGHHPHVVEDIEEYHGGYIAYSLGNFVFDQNFSPDTGRGLAVQVTLKNKKIFRFDTYNIGFTSTYQPFLR